MVMARGAGRHRRRLRTASSARCRCGILEGSIFCGYKFTKLGNKGDNSMRRSTISVFVVTAWLLGVAIPAAAADPALNLLLKKGVIMQQEYDEALKETGQAAEAPPAKGGPVAPAKATPPAKDADGDSTVDLGKGIKFGYDRGLYTQFKDKFRLKILPSLACTARGWCSKDSLSARTLITLCSSGTTRPMPQINWEGRVRRPSSTTPT